MSLLNQVLLDLDRRRASHDERGSLPDHVRALPEIPRRGATVRLAVLCGVLAVVALVAADYWGWWPVLHMPPARDTVPPSPAAGPAAPQARAASAPVEPPAPAVEALQPRLAELPLSFMPAPPEPAPVTRRAPRAAVPAPSREPEPAAPHVRGTPAGEAQPAEIQKQVRKPTLQQQAEMEYQKGAALLQQGRAAEARELLESALRTNPGHAGARQTLTALLIESRAYADAERLLQDGLRVVPAHSGYAIALARLQVDRADLAGAIDTLQKHAEFGEQSADYQGFYAAVLQRQQRHEEAVERFHAALRLRPHSGVWLMGLGLSLQAVNRAAEAQEAYRRARQSGDLTPELQAFVEQRLRQLP